MMLIFLTLFIPTAVKNQKIDIFEIRQEDCITKCSNGLLSNIDKCNFNTTVEISPKLLSESLVVYDYKKRNGNEYVYLFKVVLKTDCQGNKNIETEFICTRIKENKFNITVLFIAHIELSEATIRAQIKNDDLTTLTFDEKQLPKLAEASDSILKINGKNVRDIDDCKIKLNTNASIECVGPAEPCLLEITSRGSSRSTFSNKHILQRYTFEDGDKLNIKHALCGFEAGFKLINCTFFTAASDYKGIGEIKMKLIENNDSKRCSADLLGDNIRIESNVFLSDEFMENSVVVFEIKTDSIREMHTLFSVDIQKECTGNIKHENYYYCSRIADNTYNISINIEVLYHYSKSTIKGIIKHRNQTEMASDELAFPKIVKSTDIAEFTMNGKNVTDNADCKFSLDEATIILDIDFACNGTATPCLIEISANDSTKVDIKENRSSFKRLLTEDVILKLKIRYALCRLDHDYKYMDCIITKRGPFYQRITVIILIATGIPMALVFLFSFYSILRLFACKKSQAAIDKDFNNLEEAEPLNIQVLETSSINNLRKQDGKEDALKVLNQENCISKLSKDEMSFALIRASEKGHKDTVETLIKNGADVNQRGNKDITSLMLASLNGNCEIVDILVENGADVNFADDDGITSLMLASQGGHFDIVKMLLENKANIKAKDKKGMNALMHAIKKRNEGIIELFLAYEADWKDKTQDDVTTLMFASESGLDNIVEMLIKNGSNVNEKDKFGSSPLLYAINNKHSSTSKVLIKHGANTNDRDLNSNTALMYAARNGLLDVVEILIKNNSNLKDISIDGSNALMFAAIKGHSDIFKILIDKGVNINDKNNDGMNALMIASQNGHQEIVQFIFEYFEIIFEKKVKSNKFVNTKIPIDFDVNEKNAFGYTALMLAALNGYTQILEILLKFDANVNDVDNHGFTPLMLASWYEHFDTCKTLIEAGAEVNHTDNYGGTAIMHSSQNGLTNIVRMLHYHKGNINVTDKNGMTALMFALMNKKIETAELLLKLGAKVTVSRYILYVPLQNNYGMTCLMFAAKNGLTSIAEIIINIGASVKEKDDIGRNAFMYACKNGHVDTAELLLMKDKKLINIRDNQGLNALMMASFCGQMEICRWLITKGADYKCIDNKGKTALTHALGNKREAIVEILIDCGVDGNEKDENGLNALMHESQNMHVENVKKLIKNKADINAENNLGQTALILASIKGCTDVVDILINNEADVNKSDQLDKTSLKYALENKHMETAEKLILNGANCKEQDKNGNTLLMLASQNGQTFTVEMLIRNGVIPKDKNNLGKNALILACEYGHTELAELLLREGLEINVTDKEGCTALMFACKMGHTGTAKMLLEKGANVDAKDKNEMTALMYASQNGHTDTAKLFL